MKARQIQDSDFPALQEIFRMNRGREVAWLNPDRPEDNFKEQSEGEAIIVAESAGEILGFVSVWVPESFIHHLYVHRDHQGRGVGRFLVDEVAHLCAEDLTLKCVRANQGAMDFYLKTGWTEVSSGIGSDGEYALLKRRHTEAGSSNGGYLRQRAERANLKDFDRLLALVPDCDPDPGDELPPKHRRRTSRHC